jgi:hypothetical protein
MVVGWGKDSKPTQPAPTQPAGMVWIPAGNVRLGQVGVPNAVPVNDS